MKHQSVQSGMLNGESGPPFAEAQRTYALHFAGAVVGARLSDNEVSDHLAKLIFESISRKEELTTTNRDRWGCWDWQYSEAHRRGQLYLPWIDMPLAQLRTALQSRQPKRVYEPLWPHKKPFAVCLTHDVDAVISHESPRAFFHTIRRDLQSDLGWRMCRWRAKVIALNWIKQLSSHVGRPTHDFEEWMKLEDSFGFRSTFFFFPSRLLHRHNYDCIYQFHDVVHHGGTTMMVGEMMRALDRAGWDIGLHGSYQSAVETGVLEDERRQIEQVLQHTILSTRQHWLHYEVQRTPRLQAEAGFQADSTLGFNRSIGFRAGTAFPFWCWDHDAGRSLPILEVPQHIMDGGLFQSNSLEYDEALAIRHGVEIMDAVERVGGCLTLSWHAHNVNNEQYWIVSKTLVEEAARRNAWGCSVRDLYDWWSGREQRLRDESPTNRPVEKRDATVKIPNLSVQMNDA